MPHRKTFDSDNEEDLNFEILKPEKAHGDLNDTDEDQDSSDEKISLTSDVDSDSAPEDIDFKVSRETTLSKVKETIKQIEEERQKKRLKRRKQDQLFKDQKKKKLEDLKKKRLPDDFLADLSDTKVETSAPRGEKLGEDATTQKQQTEEIASSDSSSEKEEENEDFIELEKSETVKPVYIKEALHKSIRSASDNAADFRRNALFGSKVKRESAKDMQRKRLKRKANSSSLL